MTSKRWTLLCIFCLKAMPGITEHVVGTMMGGVMFQWASLNIAEDDDQILVCHPWSDVLAATTHYPFPIAKRKCSSCGRDVCVDRRNLEVIEPN